MICSSTYINEIPYLQLGWCIVVLEHKLVEVLHSFFWSIFQLHVDKRFGVLEKMGHLYGMQQRSMAIDLTNKKQNYIIH